MDLSIFFMRGSCHMNGGSRSKEDWNEEHYLPDRFYICRDVSTANFSKDTRVQNISSFPNTSRIDKNDMTTTIKQTCGIRSNKKCMSVPYMVNRRALGHSFTTGDRLGLVSNLLPTELNVIARYSRRVFCGIYSKDAKLFLTACQDKLLRLYEIKNSKYKEFRRMYAMDVGWSILDAAFSPDNRFAAYSTFSETIYLRPVHEDPNCQITIPLAPECRMFGVFSLVFSSDSELILLGSKGGYVYLLNPYNQCSFKFLGHDEDVNSVGFTDDCPHIMYSAGDDGLCKVWDRRLLNSSKPNPVRYLAGHMDGITYADSRGDQRYLITNSKDQTIKLWDLRFCSDRKTVDNARQCVKHQNWDYRWQRIPKRLCEPCKVLEGDSSVMTYRGHTIVQTLIRCHFSPAFTTGQRYIYTGCASGRVIIYDILTGKIVQTLTGHAACVRDVSWHPYDHELVSSGWDGKVIKWRHSVKVMDY